MSSRQITSTEVQVISDRMYTQSADSFCKDSYLSVFINSDPNCFTQFVYGLLNIPTIIEDFSTLEHITEAMDIQILLLIIYTCFIFCNVSFNS